MSTAMQKSSTTGDYSRFERVHEFPGFAPERVWAALTTPADMRRWLARDVEVDPRVGGKFAFSGPSIPWCTSAREANQRLTEWTPAAGGGGGGGSLAFHWKWSKCESTVSMRVGGDAEGKATSLQIVHEGRGPLSARGHETHYVMQDFWRIATGNLHQYLRSGAPALLPDYTDATPGVRLSIVIDAPIERVFAALVNPEVMNRWIATSAIVEPRRGGVYSYGWTTTRSTGEPEPVGPLRVLEIEEPTRAGAPGSARRRASLVTDWHYSYEKGDSRVSWELEAIDDRSTRLTLRHIGIEDTEPNRGGYIGGWTSFAIELKLFMERGESA